jgi:uncharacterized membrane protein HdeD (DUF308 family)
MTMTSDHSEDARREFGLFGDPLDFTDNAAMSQQFALNWWVVGLRGLFTLIFGAIALLLPGVTIAALIVLFAAYMLVDGVLAIIAAVRAGRRHERWGLLLLEGILDLVAGGIAIVWPLITVLAFVYLLAAWSIVTGGLMFSASFRLNLTHGRWLLALAGVASIVWGIALLFWPFVGAIVLAWWMGAYALVFGVTLLILAFRLRRRRMHPLPGEAPSHA